MESFSDYIKRNLDDIDFMFSPEGKLVYREVNGFHHDAKMFMQSKRFERFAKMVLSKIETFLASLNLVSVYENNRCGKDTPNFIQCLMVTVMEYSTKMLDDLKLNKKGDMIDEDVRVSKEGVHFSFSLHYLLYGIPYKSSSPLFDLEDFVGEKLDYNEIFMSEESDSESSDEKKKYSLLLRPVWSIVNDDLFPILCLSCLERACYNFIHLKMLEQNLQDESWYTAVKTITNEQLIWIMSNTFELLMYEVEARAGCLTLYMLPNGSPRIFKELQEATEEIENLKEQAKAEDERVKELLAKRDRDLQSVRNECNVLQNKLDNMESNDNEIVKLKRKVKALEQELQSTKDRLASAEQYTDELQEAMNEPDTEPVTDTAIDPTMFADKRIVFIRDKANENYVIMKRLAESFPSARFTNCIASDINANATDLIVVFTSYVHHCIYYNASSIARRKHIPIISTYKANYDMVLADIARAFDK